MTTVNVLAAYAAHSFLVSRWQRLFDGDQLATPYQSPTWLTAWARHLPENASPLLLLAKDAHGAPVAGLALVREHHENGRTRLTALGSPTGEFVRLTGPRSEDAAVAAAMVRTLRDFARNGEHVCVPDVPLASTLGRLLAIQRDWSHAMTSSATVLLPVGYAKLPRDDRRAHQRRRQVWQNLKDDGHTVLYRRCAGSALPEAWTVLKRLHRARWGGGRLPDAELRSVMEQPGSFIARLDLDGETIAAQLCLTRGPHAYSLLPAMDPSQRHIAPGHALLRHLTADLHHSGFRALELGRTRNDAGQRAYKRQYGPRMHTSVSASYSFGSARAERVHPFAATAADVEAA